MRMCLRRNKRKEKKKKKQTNNSSESWHYITKRRKSQRPVGLWLYKAIFMIVPLNLKVIIFQK